MLDNQYVYKKEVDWSLLNQGMSIPIDIQVVLKDSVHDFIKRGESKDISLVLDGLTYRAKLINQKFDEVKYEGHKDILQIRYNPQSDFAIRLRGIFYKSYNFLYKQRSDGPDDGRTYIKLLEEQKEYLAIYTTMYQDTFLLEPITNDEVAESINYINRESEEDYERSINYDIVDPDATIQIIQRFAKVRKLNRAIGENLKLLYGYRCQICGENFGSRYDTHIVETHHIESYITSHNNDASNQLIICPNHHRIIHKTQPVLNRRDLFISYPNGYEEKIVINRHL